VDTSNPEHTVPPQENAASGSQINNANTSQGNPTYTVLLHLDLS